eukprot:403360269
MKDLARNVYYRQSLEHSPLSSRQSQNQQSITLNNHSTHKKDYGSSSVSKYGMNNMQSTQSPVSKKLFKDPNLNSFDFKNYNPLMSSEQRSKNNSNSRRQNQSPINQKVSPDRICKKAQQFQERDSQVNSRSAHSSVSKNRNNPYLSHQNSQFNNKNVHQINFTSRETENSQNPQKNKDTSITKHKFQNVRENSQKAKKGKKKFLNAYKSKENKILPSDLLNIQSSEKKNAIFQSESSLGQQLHDSNYSGQQPINIKTHSSNSYSTLEYYSNNKEVLQNLASNEKVVEWVTLMVNFHKYKSEEKKLIDLVLQCIYKILFPEQKINVQLKSILSDIENLIDHSQQLYLMNREQILGSLRKIIAELEYLYSSDYFNKTEQMLNKLSEMVLLLRLQGELPNEQPLKLHRKESSIYSYPQNITVSEIEEPLLQNQPTTCYNQQQIPCQFQDTNHKSSNSFYDIDPRSMRLSLQSTCQISRTNFDIQPSSVIIHDNTSPQSASVVERRQLINEPKSLEAKLVMQSEKFEAGKQIFPKKLVQQSTFIPQDKYRSQSEGQRLIKHIEESLESISQYMRISDSSQSLQNTMQALNIGGNFSLINLQNNQQLFQQHSHQNSMIRTNGKLNMSNILAGINQQSPIKGNTTPQEQNQSVIPPQSQEQNQIQQQNGAEEHRAQQQNDREIWSADKKQLELQLEEAIMINTKLFEKVKRLENQIRDILNQNSLQR